MNIDIIIVALCESKVSNLLFLIKAAEVHRPTEQILLCCLYGAKPPGPRRPEKPSHVLCGGDGPLTSDSEHCRA